MTEHHNVVAERLASYIEEQISGFSGVDQIAIYNELIDRIDERLRTAMSVEYGVSVEDLDD
jgi:hypothetical protein